MPHKSSSAYDHTALPIMTCGREHPTLENSAAPLHTQLILTEIADTYVSSAYEARRRLHRQIERWYQHSFAKRTALYELVRKYVADEHCLTPAEWDAFVKGSKFKLAYMMYLPCSGKRAASLLTGAMFKRYLDNKLVKISINESTLDLEVKFARFNHEGIPLKDSREWFRAAQTVQSLLVASMRNGVDVPADDWEDALYEWKAATFWVDEPPHLPEAVSEHMRTLAFSYTCRSTWHDENCDCARCIGPAQLQCVNPDEDQQGTIGES